MRRLSNVSSNDTSTSGKKFVPWEPSKPSIQNKSLPQLIPYSLPKSSGSNETLDEELISQIRNKRNGVYYQNGFTHSGHQSESNELENKTCNGNVHAESPSSINETLQRELEIEREVNQELKKLLVAALSEDVQCHVQSLAEDKVRLAKKMDKFAYHVSMDAERVNELCIENNIWRCKYLAMGIKADELSYSLHRAVAYLKN
uniref:Uncharacterized protein n=1 Tax=Acrobeloides nanus TaxID=290746 RepID=A0A914C9L6_9BILA